MKIANALSIVLGVVLFLIAAQWIFTPATAAETLSMPFLVFCCGLVYMFAAIFNVISSIYHGAPLGLSSLISEIVFTSMAYIAALNFKKAHK